MATPALAELEQRHSLSEKIAILHRALRDHYPFIDRVAVAVYDLQTDYLKTFLGSNTGEAPIVHYQAKLAETPGLCEIAASGTPRIVDDLRDFDASTQEHTQRLVAAGFRSSYTMPMFFDGDFFGFVFFNSTDARRFAPDVVSQIDPFGRLLALMVVSEIRAIRRLSAATKTIRHITASRDCETGAHLERMSRYARIIACELAEGHNLSDEYIDHVFLFSPMHDIGKIAIPDIVLLKPGGLDHDEYALMQTHTDKGLEMVDYMLAEFDLSQLVHVEILRNIVFSHHEWIDGSGYPCGLAGDEIPLEARIVTTADIFDALTSRRPYKQAWSNEEAFASLRRLAGSKLDKDCVEALQRRQQEIETIQARFHEDAFG
ncbi:MAG: HD domain-containing protein [Pseudomonadota bacterium]|nr:MAG: HD domain-containing protein [Pseudomonadota bacterium]